MSDDHSPFIEPWTPRIGQPVRFRASAECPAFVRGDGYDGATGVVTDVAPYHTLAQAGIEHPAHRFEVTFDDGSRDRCCAAELQPTEASP